MNCGIFTPKRRVYGANLYGRTGNSIWADWNFECFPRAREVARLWVPSRTTMNNSASESGVRGREQHPNLTEVEKIKAVKGKMNDALFEFMQCATVLGLSCFVMMSTGKDGEEIVHCDDFSMIKAMGAVTDKVNGDGNSNQINPVIRQMNQSMRGENDANESMWYLLSGVKRPRATGPALG